MQEVPQALWDAVCTAYQHSGDEGGLSQAWHWMQQQQQGGAWAPSDPACYISTAHALTAQGHPLEGEPRHALNTAGASIGTGKEYAMQLVFVHYCELAVQLMHQASRRITESITVLACMLTERTLCHTFSSWHGIAYWQGLCRCQNAEIIP